MAGEDTVIATQLIELIGGVILLAAAYFAIMARRSDHPGLRREYSRAVLQYAGAFLVFAYAVYVLWPASGAWPADMGKHLYLFFTAMETIPKHLNGQLTDYYHVLLRQIGYATGHGLSPGVLGVVEGTVRTIGLVVYTVVFAVVSLGLQVPSRIAEAVQNAVNGAEEQI